MPASRKSAQPLSAATASILMAAFEESGRTQAEVGAAADVSQSQLSKYLRGVRVPTLDTLDAICDALGVDVAVVVAEASRRRR